MGNKIISELYKDFYKNKKVLITGNTGFKGSWITLWLHEMNAEVFGYSLEPPSEPNMFNILELDKKIKQFYQDVTNLDNLIEVINKIKPDIIFHLAAQSLVRISYNDPVDTYKTNIMGTINVLEAVRKTNCVKTVINVTSDKCYDNKEWIYAYRETDPMGGYDPYSSSKGCSELITNAYSNSFFNLNDYNIKHNTLIASVRAGNIIGGGDWALDRIIPDTMKALSLNKSIIIRNPNAIRPWQHVMEPVSGYLLLAMKLYNKGKKYAGGWNFGPDNNDVLTVDDLVKIIIKWWGSGNIEYENNPGPHEAKFLRLDAGKAYFYLNWKPVYNVNSALQKTIEWYKKYYEKKNNNEMYNITVSQIAEYSKNADYTNI